MVLYRLAEIYKLDVAEVEHRFSGEEIMRWSQYFAQREKEYGKLDHYAITLIGAVAGITGSHVELEELMFDQGDQDDKTYTAAELFDMFNAVKE